MPQIIGHLKAKEFLLETHMLPAWDRFMIELRAGKTPLTKAQALCVDELERLFDVAKLTPLRQANWYKRNRPSYKPPAKSKTKCRAEFMRVKLARATELARKMGMDVVLRDRYYVLLEQGREILHSLSVSYFYDLCSLEYKTRQKIKPRSKTVSG